MRKLKSTYDFVLDFYAGYLLAPRYGTLILATYCRVVVPVNSDWHPDCIGTTQIGIQKLESEFINRNLIQVCEVLIWE